MQLKYQFTIRTLIQNFNQTIACSATCIFVCNILKLSLTKKHIEWSQFQHSHCIHYYSMHGPLVCNIELFHSVVSQVKIFKCLTLSFLYFLHLNYLCYFFPNVGVTLLLKYIRYYYYLIYFLYLNYLCYFFPNVGVTLL